MNRFAHIPLRSMKTVFFALNKNTKRVAILPFSYWEEVQSAFRVGISMGDGTSATGIGRCKAKEFESRRIHSGFSFVTRQVCWDQLTD